MPGYLVDATLEPTHVAIVVTNGSVGLALHPLPLPGGLAPEAWVQQVAEVLGPSWAATARWALVAAAGRGRAVTLTHELREVAGALQ